MTIRFLASLAAAFALALAPSAAAQDKFPSKPLKIIVPYSAGGGADILARLIGQELATRLGQPVVVENKGGASNTLGMKQVLASGNDGHTLGLATPVFVMTPSLMKEHPYDPLTDFVPVAMIGNTPLVLAVHPGVEARTTQEFIALARARPGAFNFASLGAATTQGLAATMFNSMAGIEAVQVPYKGSAPGVNDLLAGNVQFMFNALPSMLQHFRSGRLRPLGTTGATRSRSLPDVPTVEEALPGYQVVTWYTLVAPAGSPPAAVEILNREVAAILATPAVQEKLRTQGLEPNAMPPAEIAALFRAEGAKWARVIREAKLARD